MKLAGLAPVAVDDDLAALREGLDDPSEKHVGALPRAVDGEVPQDDHVEPELGPVDVRELLARELRHPVGRPRRGEVVSGVG